MILTMRSEDLPCVPKNQNNLYFKTEEVSHMAARTQSY